MDNINHLLIIDDDKDIRNLLSQFLRENGYFVTESKDTKEAKEKLNIFNFDLLIVDVMMPGEDGISFTKKLRNYSKTPILMLTAINDIENKISGLESGADDYLEKPFEPRELILRIKNILNRTKNTPKNNSTYYFGDYEFDVSSKSLRKNNIAVLLTSNEADFINILCQNMNKIVSREQLASINSGINERSIDVQITRLRSKIEDNPKNSVFLKTIRGKGYILYGKEEL